MPFEESPPTKPRSQNPHHRLSPSSKADFSAHSPKKLHLSRTGIEADCRRNGDGSNDFRPDPLFLPPLPMGSERLRSKVSISERAIRLELDWN
jgi:hypothetical protein